MASTGDLAQCRIRKFAQLSAVESSVHALQQQQSGASTQLSAFSTRLDNLEDTIAIIGQRIANALVERDLNQIHPVNQGCVKVPRELSVSCLPELATLLLLLSGTLNVTNYSYIIIIFECTMYNKHTRANCPMQHC